MNGIARLPASERADLFTETAARMGISGAITEKDFWVCWTLGQLHSIETLPRLLYMQKELEADYGKMEQMFFEAPPRFGDILAALQRIQGTIMALRP